MSGQVLRKCELDEEIFFVIAFLETSMVPKSPQLMIFLFAFEEHSWNTRIVFVEITNLSCIFYKYFMHCNKRNQHLKFCFK